VAGGGLLPPWLPPELDELEPPQAISVDEHNIRASNRIFILEPAGCLVVLFIVLLGSYRVFFIESVALTTCLIATRKLSRYCTKVAICNGMVMVL
jgi:hypothetical protein